MHTEEYVVTGKSFSPPGPIPPTTQIIMDVRPTNAPPTPIPQMKVIKSSVQSGFGSEIEQTQPAPPPTVTLYGKVNLKDTRFNTLKTKLQDPLCTVHLRYQSEVQNGNDPINNFELIYVY